MHPVAGHPTFSLSANELSASYGPHDQCSLAANRHYCIISIAYVGAIPE